MSKEFQRMQKLAGLITEVNIEPKFLNFHKPTSTSLTYKDPELSLDGTEIFRWKEQPRHPEDILTMYNNDDGTIQEEFTKQSFWDTDITGRQPEDMVPEYASKEPNNTWTFDWGGGTSIGGFVNGEDFTFGK